MVWTVIGLAALFALALYVLGILGQAVELLAIGAMLRLSVALLPIGLKTGECLVAFPLLSRLFLRSLCW